MNSILNKSKFGYSLVCLALIFSSSSICNGQNKEKQKSPLILGIAITPGYDGYNPVSLHYYHQGASLRELQVLVATDINSPEKYLRFESGINWLITEKNKSRRFQVYPSTSLSYIIWNINNESSSSKEGLHESFLSLGVNTNIPVYKNIFITAKGQLGYGFQFGNEPEISDMNADESAINFFYYIGIRVLLNRK